MIAAWISLFLVGTLAGMVAVWLGVTGIALLILITFAFVVARAAKPWASGGFVGIGVGMAAIVLWSAANCPAETRYDGGRATCEGPDLGAYVVVAVGLAVVGALVTLHEVRRGRRT